MKNEMLKMVTKIAPNPGRVYEMTNGREGLVCGWAKIKLAWTDEPSWKPDFVQTQSRWVDMSEVDELVPMRDALDSFLDGVWDSAAPSRGIFAASVLSDGRMLYAGARDVIIWRERCVYDVPGLFVFVPEIMIALMQDAGKDGRLACSDGAVAYADGKHRVYVGVELNRMQGVGQWIQSAREWIGGIDGGLEPVEMNWRTLVDELEKGERCDRGMWRSGSRWLNSCRYEGLDDNRRLSGWDPRPIPDKWARLALRVIGRDGGVRLEMRELTKWDKWPWCKWVTADGAARMYAKCAPCSE